MDDNNNINNTQNQNYNINTTETIFSNTQYNDAQAQSEMQAQVQINNIINETASPKQSSKYLGINDPKIKEQYIKEYNKPSHGVIISAGIMILCAIIYIFIVSNTINGDFLSKDGRLGSNSQAEESAVLVLDDVNAIDALNPDTLNIIDKTKTNSSSLVLNASYMINELDYSNDSLLVPYINIDSKDADIVNNEIKNNYKIWAKESARYKKAFENTKLDSSSLIRSYYETYTFDNVLSVVITFITRENSLESYKYYAYSFNTSNDSLIITNINQENNDVMIDNNANNTLTNDSSNIKIGYGKRLSMQELLVKLNLSFEEIDTKYQEILKTYSGEYGDSQNIIDTLTLYEEEVNAGSLDAFIDSEGNINLISKLFTPLYEKGTYRMFKYIEGEFEPILLNTSNS